MVSVSNFLSYVSNLAHNEDGDGLADTVVWPPEGNDFTALRAELHNIHNVSDLVAGTFQQSQDRPLADFYSAFLTAVQEYGSPSATNSEGGRDLKNLTPAFSAATTLFQYSKTSWVVPFIRKIASVLLEVSIVAGRQAATPAEREQLLLETSKTIQRAHGISIQLGSRTSPTSDPTFHLTNLIIRLYFEIDNTRMCDTLLAGVVKLRPRLPNTPKLDQVMFNFWEGRLAILRYYFRYAKKRLRLAFDSCANGIKTKRIMFIYLTVTSMILGIFPSSPLIAYFGLSAQFEPLIRALKQGHITTFHRVLDEWRPWFARRGLYHILNERCEILLWRNLFRRTRGIQKALIPSTPMLNFELLLAALRLSTQDKEGLYDMSDIECICANLTDQNYIRGYLIHSNRALVLARTGPEFPTPALVQLSDASDEPPPSLASTGSAY